MDGLSLSPSARATNKDKHTHTHTHKKAQNNAKDIKTHKAEDPKQHKHPDTKQQSGQLKQEPLKHLGSVKLSSHYLRSMLTEIFPVMHMWMSPSTDPQTMI